jgi:hypothetical protein
MLAGKLVSEKKLSEKPALYKSWSYTYEFYAPGFVETIQTTEELDKFLYKNERAVIYSHSEVMDELQSGGYDVRLLQRFSFFHISMLTGKFINPATREGELEKMALAIVEKKNE